MTLPYSDSKAGAAREGEIRTILRASGASAVGFMQDDDRNQIICQFRLNGREITIPVSLEAYARAWLRQHPHTSRMRSTPQQHRDKAMKHAELAAWAILRDWIKAQAAMMAAGFTDADTAFLPHIHLSDGRRVGEAITHADSPLRLPPPNA